MSLAKRSWLSLTLLALLPAQLALAGGNGTVVPGAGTTDKYFVDLTVEPWLVIDDAALVTNGVALRNCTEGWVHLRGVPQGRKVLKAFLYWNLADDQAVGNNFWLATFNGAMVTGTKVADSADACWGNIGNHTYRANVTPLLPPRRPNGNYEIVVRFNGLTSTTGQHPWAPVEPQKQRINGVTLFVLYEAPDSSVLLYDNLNGSMFAFQGDFILRHPGYSGHALFTMTGADGQRGAGYDNTASNEITTFNGAQIAGPPVAASDWDGTAGWPLTQLWDVHTHHVTLSDRGSIVSYTSPGDCLVPAAFALEVH